MVPGDPDPIASEPAPPGLRDWDAFVWYKAAWALQECVEVALAELELRGRHFAVMTMLASGAELSQQQMAAAMSMDPTTMVALIDDLERWGLAERRRNPTDRRRYAVALTEAGTERFAQARRIVDRVEADYFEGVDAAERERMVSTAATLMRPHWGRAPR